MGYHGETGFNAIEALGGIEEFLIEIKTRNWSINRTNTSLPWKTYGVNPILTFGEAVSIKYIGDIDRHFSWTTNNEHPDPEHIFEKPQHYTYTELPDYKPFFVQLRKDTIAPGSAEIALIINGDVYGATVILDDYVQIRGYLPRTRFPVDSEIKFHIRETNSGIESTRTDYRVYNPGTGNFENRAINLNSAELFYMVSFREDDDEEYDIKSTVYITGLSGNYPNPFNPRTTIQFTIGNMGDVRVPSADVGDMNPPLRPSQEGNVKIDVFNIRGQFVKTLVDDVLEPGHHTVVWNGDDRFGNSVASGIYFYRMETCEGREVRRMLLLR